jgi:hypothetical protein
MRQRSGVNQMSLEYGTSQEKPSFFVSGVMRSGTTLLHRILTNSCQSEYIKEVDAFRIIVESFGTLDKHQEYRPLGAREEFVRLYREFLAAISQSCANSMYGPVVILKDPLAIRIIEYLHELMPTTKFLLSVREPLGTIASIARVSVRQRAQGKQSFIAKMNFIDVVNYVEAFCEKILAMRGKENILIVRYEDLVHRNEAMIKLLTQYVGFNINMDLEDTSKEYDPENGFWTPESGGPIVSSSLEKYKNELTPEQIELVAERFLSFKQSFGY